MSDMTNGIYNRFVLANIDIILVIKIVKYPSKKKFITVFMNVCMCMMGMYIGYFMKCDNAVKVLCAS